MLGLMMEELNRKTLRSYAKLGEDMGLWERVDQTTLDSEGKRTRRLIISWPFEDES